MLWGRILWRILLFFLLSLIPNVMFGHTSYYPCSHLQGSECQEILENFCPGWGLQLWDYLFCKYNKPLDTNILNKKNDWMKILYCTALRLKNGSLIFCWRSSVASSLCTPHFLPLWIKARKIRLTDVEICVSLNFVGDCTGCVFMNKWPGNLPGLIMAWLTVNNALDKNHYY